MKIWKTSPQTIGFCIDYNVARFFGWLFEHSNNENSCIKCLTCFSFFKRKVLFFLKKFNEEVSSNKKYYVATMMAVVPNISYVFSHYDSHRLHANVHFSAIEKYMQSMKTDPYIIHMVPDIKQKVFQMRYQEGQVY